MHLVTGAARGIGAEPLRWSFGKTRSMQSSSITMDQKTRAEKVAAEIIAAGGKAETYQLQCRR